MLVNRPCRPPVRLNPNCDANQAGGTGSTVQSTPADRPPASHILTACAAHRLVLQLRIHLDLSGVVLTVLGVQTVTRHSIPPRFPPHLPEARNTNAFTAQCVAVAAGEALRQEQRLQQSSSDWTRYGRR